MTYSFQDRPGSKFGPPIENEKNRILNVQLIYMGYAACEALQSRGPLLFVKEVLLLVIVTNRNISIYALHDLTCDEYM